ncbi:unnamed protein product, partial [Rotaria magnacalcarata]
MNVLDMQNMSDGEYKWILYMRDRFTKCSWAYPLKSNEMGPITEKLLQQYYFFAISQALQSVHRREFAAQVIENVEKTWTNLKIINGRVLHSCTQSLTEDGSIGPFKSVLYKWMLSNNRKDWSNLIHSMKNGAANLANNKTPSEIVLDQNTNYNVEICHILSNHICLDEENLPYSFIDELKKSTYLLNVVQNTNSFNDSLSSSPSNLALQEVSKSSFSIQSSRLKYHASPNISTSTKKRRRLISTSNEEITVFDEDKRSNNNNNNKNANLINNHQQIQSKTNEIVCMTSMTNMTKGQKLFNNTSYKHEYKVGDLVGVIIDKIATVNIEFKVLACKILSIELVAEDTYAYQLYTKACIISSKFQASDLLNLCNCNFVDLLTVDPTHLPKLTFNEA